MSEDELRAVIHTTVVRWEDFGGNIETMLARALVPTLVESSEKAKSAETRLDKVRVYAEDRSIHHRARKDSVVGSWRIASDLLAILDSDGKA